MNLAFSMSAAPSQCCCSLTYTTDWNTAGELPTSLVTVAGSEFGQHVAYMVDMKNTYKISADNPSQTILKGKSCHKKVLKTNKY
jgi:hypothetical protein